MGVLALDGVIASDQLSDSRCQRGGATSASWGIETAMKGLGFARLRELPSVNAVLSAAAASALIERFGRMASTNAVRAAVAEARTVLGAGPSCALSAQDIALRALVILEEEDRTGLRPLFNLTGTVLHANLGPAALAEAAIEAAVAVMRDPVALEFDLSAGGRGERDDHVRALLCALTGAEDRREPGGAGVRRRQGGIRDRAGLPLCGDHLSVDRAVPLLDQARIDQRDLAAGGIHRDRRSLGAGEGDRTRGLGAPVLEARSYGLQGRRCCIRLAM